MIVQPVVEPMDRFTALVISDLRPKGRGRPQRILLGQWPEEHVREVIRAVVFREVSCPPVRAVPRNFTKYHSARRRHLLLLVKGNH